LTTMAAIALERIGLKAFMSNEHTITLHRPVTKPAAKPEARWSVEAIEELFHLTFPELLFRAQTVHRGNFNPSQVEFATALVGKHRLVFG